MNAPQLRRPAERPLRIAQLRSPKEPPLYAISLLFSLLVWAGLIVTNFGTGLLYVLTGAIGGLTFHALFLAAIKGNGVRITPTQLPELYRRLQSASRKLGLVEPPEAYLLNHRGILNAFATRFWGRNFVVLYAELVEACDEASGGLDFVIGHEVAHHALKHLRRHILLLPARVMPWLGPAYSRACEYSCDRAGQAVADDPQAAVTGLCVLAAGGRYGKQLNVDELLKQQATTGHFWQAVVELNMSHPFLSKRIGALVAANDPSRAQLLERNILAYPLAPLFSFAVGANSASNALIILAIIGALVAIPSFLKLQQRAAQAAMSQSLEAPGGR